MGNKQTQLPQKLNYKKWPKARGPIRGYEYDTFIQNHV